MGTFQSILSVTFMIFLFKGSHAYGMHIMEGYLPIKWSIFWWALYLPFFFVGVKKLKQSLSENLEKKLLISLIGAFIFLVSAIKLPSLTGSSSHATGIALGAILLGPSSVFVLGALVLFFQATLLAHGGYTTLGANAVSMAVVGALVSYFIYTLFRKRMNNKVAIFLAAALGDLLTYICTALQLALAHPVDGVNYIDSIIKFLGVFAVTQIPLAIIEGLITVVIINMLPVDLISSTLIKKEVTANA
ncbi:MULTISPECIES: energy-coupling factor ABC transporter permease [unclassified Cetobacterium]|uniref:energy-coupling factor ABC transporter permease n=1 Tax=unclassified Cetobacterium TaxID=2630983 RepID=UPI001C8E94A1|nr:energy-coupling factor ABC transporter permease [Cetobacterium sp. 2A]